VARSRKQFIFGMSCQTPQLSAMPENHLVESSLQRSFEDVVSGGADVNVSVVATWSLRVDGSDSASVFGKLEREWKLLG
jgi:hypothetical protein